MKQNFIIIRPDSTYDEVLINTDNLLEGMYETIGCELIETVPLGDEMMRLAHIKHPCELLVICDEEGAIKGEPEYNEIASNLVGTAIFGNVLIATASEEDITGLGYKRSTRILQQLDLMVGYSPRPDDWRQGGVS